MNQDTKAFIKMETLCKQIDTSKKTIENWIREGLFVPAVAFCGRSKRFNVQELEIYYAGVIAQQDRKELVKEIVDARSTGSKV
ncbi:helix-turn-helix transcriptional regulator [Vibrio superstes]|uniref:Helix-turn-helix domain-containing protein n=1 Tax=Vibrio superstes NBRC 103154 TaxID=1219062 RepID=A0A511QN65_9VIBR|nr:hypothetical protein [Vibrio superstes]GEM78759.1 hypothetical protein VSU01S_10040 [Vibrio superstes NBRC 103154]